MNVIPIIIHGFKNEIKSETRRFKNNYLNNATFKWSKKLLSGRITIVHIIK